MSMAFYTAGDAMNYVEDTIKVAEHDKEAIKKLLRQAAGDTAKSILGGGALLGSLYVGNELVKERQTEESQKQKDLISTALGIKPRDKEKTSMEKESNSKFKLLQALKNAGKGTLYSAGIAVPVAAGAIALGTMNKEKKLEDSQRQGPLFGPLKTTQEALRDTVQRNYKALQGIYNNLSPEEGDSFLQDLGNNMDSSFLSMGKKGSALPPKKKGMTKEALGGLRRALGTGWNYAKYNQGKVLGSLGLGAAGLIGLAKIHNRLQNEPPSGVVDEALDYTGDFLDDVGTAIDNTPENINNLADKTGIPLQYLLATGAIGTGLYGINKLVGSDEEKPLPQRSGDLPY